MHDQPTTLPLSPPVPAAPAAQARPLWLAIGALAVAVAALGGTLLGTQLSSRPAPAPNTELAAGLVPFEAQGSAGPATPQTAPQAPRPAPAAVRAPAPAPAAGPAPVPIVRATPAALCNTCGTVVSVTAVDRAVPASGIGAVAGGVVGGVLGNQVGGGSGRAVATVLGAVGGGWAGHEAEKHVRKTTAYAVRVRMDDGSMRTVEQGSAVAVGSPVMVQGGTVRPRGVAVSG